MSDVFLTSQQLNQALTRLIQSAPGSNVARQAAEVLVQHLAGNQLQLTGLPDNKSVQLPKSLLQGQLISGQRYKVTIENHNTQQLLTFLSNEVKQPSPFLNLTQPQSQAILQLSPKTLAPLLATSQLIDAKVTQISGNKVQLAVDIGGQTRTVSVTLPQPDPNLKTGQSVKVQLLPIGDQLHARLLPSKTPQQTSTPSSVFVVSQPLPKAQTQALLAATLTQSDKGLPISTTQFEKLLQSVGLSKEPVLSQAVVNLKTSQVVLLMAQDGRLSIVSEAIPKAVARLPLTPEQLIKLEGLKIPRIQPADTQTIANPPQKPTSAPIPAVSTTVSPQSQTDGSVGPPNLTPGQVKMVYESLQRALPQSASPAEVLQKLEVAIKDIKEVKSPEVKQLLQDVAVMLKTGTVEGQKNDFEAVRQLLSAPTFPVTPVSIVSPPASQGMLAGLMTMLQISLATRLVRNQPPLAEKVAQIIRTLTPAGPGATASPPPRNLAELQNWEQRHQVLREAGRLLASHQTNKLINIEQLLQGQDSFYYALPSAMGDARRDIELLIRREQDPQDKEQKKAKAGSTWHLTLKFELGALGEMLTKAKLKQSELELDIYTSNEASRNLVLNYLPLLKRRFEELEIHLANSRCQLGKIPDSLQPRAYQIFEAKA